MFSPVVTSLVALSAMDALLLAEPVPEARTVGEEVLDVLFLEEPEAALLEELLLGSVSLVNDEVSPITGLSLLAEVEVTEDSGMGNPFFVYQMAG